MADAFQSTKHLSQEEKRQLLLSLLRKKIRNPDTSPLSFSQQRLWFLDQLLSDQAVYTIPIVLRLTGSLDKGVLARALHELYRRHEILRTIFPLVGKQPVQMVTSPSVVEMPVIDLKAFPTDQREGECWKILKQEIRQPFPLATGPVFRMKLIHLAEQEHILVFTIHHIAFDGWSIPILTQELISLYTAFSSGAPSPLAPLPFQYADFARWQRQWLSGERLEKQLGYWRQKLAQAPAVLELPLDHPRPAEQASQGSRIYFSLSPALSQQLQDLARREGATLFMVLLAAFQTLLYRYTGQEDILVGTPVAGRTRAEFEALIGFFVNTLVLRSNLSGNPSFRVFLQQVRETTLSAYAHQDLPFERLVDELHLERNLSISPLFQVMLVLQNTPPYSVNVPGLTVEPVQIENDVTRFDLTLTFLETPQGLGGDITYNSALFSKSTIQRLLEHLETLLVSISADPQQRLEDLTLLASSERQQILQVWSRSPSSLPLPSSADSSHALQRFFEEQASRLPQRPALVCGDQCFSYDELNTAANRLAHTLRAQGLGPGSLVGLCLPRTPDLLVCLLAVLKAGAAYLPLDARYPLARLQFMLQDSRAQAVLCTSQTRAALDATTVSCPIFDLSLLLAASQQQPDFAPVPPPVAVDLAYVIYTSGSTGQPKGVEITHGNGQAFLRWALATYPPDTLQGVLASTSICFDLSIFELFAPLSAGGCVLLVEDALHVLDLPEDGPVPVRLLNMVPSVLSQLVHPGGPGLPASVHTVNVAGEPLMRSLVESLYANEHVQRVYNLYGPTEATTYATVALLAPGQSGTPPIGRPLAGSRLYLLDARLQPVGVGMVGEIYLGGDGVARGYRNRAGVTAERFLPDPYSDEPGARFYRTGDLGRYRADGQVEFLGRRDGQVKLRGYRIELGEIEQVLNGCAGVAEGVVVVRERRQGKGERRLVAYVRGEVEEPPLALDVLQQELQAVLPEYMVPREWMQVSQWPRTTSGKIDRAALPEPAPALPIRRENGRGGTPEEEQLRTIWQEVLGRSEIGLYDNFFELGGDSILSISIVAQAHQVGLHLNVRQVFQYQTIAELARVAGKHQHVSDSQESVSGEVPLTPIQRWFFTLKLPVPHHWNQALLLQVKQPLQTQALTQALLQLVQHHDSLRLRFRETATGWEQYYVDDKPADLLPLLSIDLQGLSTQEQRSAFEACAVQIQSSLHLTRGPLFRVVYFQIGSEQADRLLLVSHHLIIDGVSWRILLADLLFLYRYVVSGQHASLPPRTASYKDWASRLAASAQTTDLRSEVAYWKDLPWQALRPIPLDYEVDSFQALSTRNTEAQARSINESLSVNETDLLLHEVPAAYHTQINDVLLAALALTIKRWTGHTTLLFDLEGHGRSEFFHDLDVSRTTGWFTTIIPALLQIESQDDEYGFILKTVKEQLRSIAHHEFSYGILRYSGEEGQEAPLSSLPRAEMVFNYFGQLDQTALRGSDLTVAPERVGSVHDQSGTRTHLFEISCSVIESRFQIQWTYSEELHAAATVRTLCTTFAVYLRNLIKHCLSEQAGGRTPTDFPLLPLSQEQLDHLLDVVTRTRRTLSWRQKLAFIEDIYPLSPMQHGLLFHDLYEPGRQIYFEQADITLQGELDFALFERSWQQLWERYPVLRTRFHWLDLPLPVQLIPKGEAASLALRYEDWRNLPEAVQAEKLAAFLQEDKQRGFVLDQEALLRLTLIRQADQLFHFVLSFSHLLLDGWSLSILLKDFFAIYDASLSQSQLRLSSSRPYRDYIEWLLQQDIDAAEVFWRRNLQGFSSATACLPAEHIEDAQTGNDWGVCLLHLSEHSSDELRVWARQQQVTLNTILQGAWALLLRWYSGENDVLFGITVSGRPAELSGIEGMVGLFVNTLPFRVFVAEEQSLSFWLQRIQQHQLDLRQYEHTPLVKIQNWSEVQRGQPLFETLLVVENYPVDSSLRTRSEQTLTITDISISERTNYPLTLLVSARGQITLRAYYDCARVSDAAIQQLLEHLKTLLERICTDPQQRVKAILPEDMALPSLQRSQRSHMIGDKAAGTALPVAAVQAEKDDKEGWLPEEERLRQVWREVLGRDEIGPRDNFFELGGDSILSLQVISRARQLGLHLQIKDLFSQPTLSELAAAVGRATQVHAEQGVVTGSVPLTPVQHWFFAHNPVDPHHWNQTVLLKLAIPLSEAVLKQAFAQLLAHHDALRLRFQHTEAGWKQENASVQASVPFERVDLSALPEQEQWASLHARTAEAQASLKLDAAPLLRALLFDVGKATPGYLLILIHHLVVDGVSWRILLEDLQSLCIALSEGQASLLPLKTTSYQQWATRLEEYVQSEQIQREIDFWSAQIDMAGEHLPTDIADSLEAEENTVSSARTVSMTLGREEMQNLLELARQEHVSVEAVLLAALSDCLTGWVKAPVLIDLEHHGRDLFLEGIDLLRTVGWFTAIFPFPLGGEERADGSEIWQALEKRLKSIPQSGQGYGLLRYVCREPEIAARLRKVQAEISFNYLGQFDQTFTSLPLFTPVLDFNSPARSQQSQRAYLFEITCLIMNNQFQVNWTYSERFHHHSTVMQLVQDFSDALRQILQRNQLSVASRPAHRFAHRGLERANLEALLQALSAQGKSTEALAEFEDIYALSPAQKGMLFQSLSERTPGMYIEQFCCLIHGDLDIARFERAWSDIIEQQQVLRTSFFLNDLVFPLQLIHRSTPLSFHYDDWQKLSADECEMRLQHYLEQERTRGFDVSRPPLMRFALIKIEEYTYRFVWSFHHLLLDGWSVGLVLGHVIRRYIYGTVPAQHRKPLSSYGDYIAWLEGRDAAAARRFWEEQLRGFTAPTIMRALSGGRQPVSYGRRRLFFSTEATAELVALTQQQRLTLNTLVQGAWALLLSRYSGSDDVVFGITVSGRPADLPDIANVAGLFINTLPLRVQISPTDLLSWLRALQARQVEMQQFEYTPLGAVQEWSNLPGGSPLFEYILVFENYPVSSFLSEHLENLHLTDARTFGAQTQYPLTLLVLPGKQLSLEFIYDSQRFSSEMIEQMLAQLHTLFVEIGRTFAQAVSPQLAALSELIRPLEEVEGAVEGVGNMAVKAPSRPPQTILEKELIAVWREFFPQDTLGVDTNIFDLGGHSLLITRIAVRLREVLGIEIPLRVFFEAPTIAEITRLIESGAFIQREARNKVSPLVPTSRRSALPLSYAQQRLFFLSQLEPESGFYNIPVVVYLKGTLDFLALTRSFQAILQRHEAVRTNFAVVHGEAVQIVREASNLVLVSIDLRAVPSSERKALAHALAKAEIQRPFDVQTDLLLRATLFQLAEGEYLLAVVMHHIISDGWSLSILVEEITALYRAFAQGNPSPLAPLPVQYADFACWQREWLTEEVLRSDQEYWREQLQNAPALFTLPPNYPRPAIQSYRGATCNLILPPALGEAMARLCRQEGVTLFMVLLAAFDLLLSYYTQQARIVVGTDVANRPHDKLGGLIGFFINQLVLYVDLTHASTFLELLHLVRDVTLDAYAHQDLPFDKLVETLNPARTLQYAPLFQVKLVLQNVPHASADLPGLELELVELDREMCQFDLNLRVSERPEGLYLSLEYSRDLYEAATIVNLLAAFHRLLERIVVQPEGSLRELKHMLKQEEELQQRLHRQEIEAMNVRKLQASRRRPLLRQKAEGVISSENQAGEAGRTHAQEEEQTHEK